MPFLKKHFLTNTSFKEFFFLCNYFFYSNFFYSFHLKPVFSLVICAFKFQMGASSIQFVLILDF